MLMPPDSRISTWARRSDRISGPACFDCPTLVFVATVIGVKSSQAGPRQFLICRGSTRRLLPSQFRQNGICHLDRAGSSLTDGLGAAWNPHHVVGTHLAFADNCR